MTTEKERERPLSDEELRAIRTLLEQDKRVKWLWTSLRTYGLWISGTVLGFSLGFETLKKIVQFLVQK